MKSYLAGLQTNPIGTSYNSAQWSALGRANVKTINSAQVVGPPLTNFIDIQTLVGFIPTYVYAVPTQNLLFVIGPVSSTPIVAMFNFNFQTGVYSYVGKVLMTLTNVPAQTHAFRGFWAWSDGTNVRLGLATTATTAIQSGGFVTYTTKSAFTIAGTQLFSAYGSGQNNVTYFLQGSDFYGYTHNFTSTWGWDYAFWSSNAAFNTKVYMMNNTVLLPQLGVWDLSITPDVAGKAINGVSSSTTPFSLTSPSAYFSMAALNGYNTGIPSATNFDLISMMNGTANVPTPFVAWLQGTAQLTTNTWVIRDLQQMFVLSVTALTGTITAGATITINGIAFVSLSAYTAGNTSLTVVSPVSWNGTTLPTNGTGTVSAGTQVTVTITGVAAGNCYFNLAAQATPTVVVVPTQALSNFSMIRSSGLSTNMFYGRTPVGGFAPALTGTLIQTNTVNYAKPNSAPQNPSLNGADCLALSTSSQHYLGKLVDYLTPLAGSTNSTNVLTLSSTSGLFTGSSVVGPNIPAGVTITSILTSTTVQTSLAATGSGSGTFIIGNSTINSLTAANITGTGIDVVAPTLALARYGAVGLSTDVDRFAYTTNISSFVLKLLQSSVITNYFGGVDVAWMETLNAQTMQFGAAALSGIDFTGGFMFACSSTIGQRGIIFIDVLSHNDFAYSALISPILSVPTGTILREIDTLEQLFDMTDSCSFWIRSALTSGDTIFSSANIPAGSIGPTSNGWTLIKTASDLSSVAIGPYFQFCATFQSLTFTAQTPAQVQDIKYTVLLAGEIADNWLEMNERTSQSSVSPMVVSVLQSKAYLSAPSKFSLKGYDINGNLVASIDTNSQPSQVAVSGNNGSSYSPWSSMSSFMSTFNTPFTTELKFTITSPPSVPSNIIQWSFTDV